MVNKFVVLGSNSFSGSSFVSFLLQQESVEEVIGLSRSSEPDIAFLPYKSADNYEKKFTFYKLDVNYDVDDITDIIYASKAQYIVNFAAQGMVSQSWDHPKQWINTNVLSLTSLVHKLHKFSFIKAFVQASTPEVYGASDNLVESHCYQPSTPYAASKAAADMVLFSYYKTYGFPVKYTRAANIYGASQQLYRIIPKTIITILKGGQLPLHGGGVAERSFIHVSDVVHATFVIAKHGKSGDVYHLSGKETVSIYKLVAMICSLMSVDKDEYIVNVEQRSGADSKYLLNTDKIYAEFGWKPKITLRDGLLEVIDWARKNFHNINNISMEYSHKE